MFTYNAWAHPQFDRNDELLISYNTNGDFWSIFDNVELYRPRFIRVPYMLIDYAFWPNGQGALSIGSVHGAELYPNPVVDLATLQLQLPKDCEVGIQIMDLNGRLLRVYPVQSLGQGSHRLQVDFSELPAGFFLISVNAGSEVHRIRAVKTSD